MTRYANAAAGKLAERLVSAQENGNVLLARLQYTALSNRRLIAALPSLLGIPKSRAICALRPAGLNATDVLAALKAAHAGGAERAGLDVETGEPADLYQTQGIVDLYTTKWWALRLASDAAVTVLKVDQIIMVRQGFGSRPGFCVRVRVLGRGQGFGSGPEPRAQGRPGHHGAPGFWVPARILGPNQGFGFRPGFWVPR